MVHGDVDGASYPYNCGDPSYQLVGFRDSETLRSLPLRRLNSHVI